jgi:hypothetical protein
MTPPSAANLGLNSPRLIELYQYWLDKRGDRIAPSRAALQPEEITHLLPQIFLIDVVDGPRRFRFRLVGTAIVEVFGDDPTGRFVDELELNLPKEEMLEQYLGALRERCPLWRRWRYTKPDGRLLEYERLILPLSSHGNSIDMLLCGAASQHIHSDCR